MPNPEVYSLEPNDNVIPGAKNAYMLSVYHQLHCLKELQIAFVGQKIQVNNSLGTASSTVDAIPNPVGKRHGSHKHGQGPADSTTEPRMMLTQMHAEHCFDYLREGVMCAGDTTLEGPDSAGRTIEVWGAMHDCRKWSGAEGLEQWAMEHIVQ